MCDFPAEQKNTQLKNLPSFLRKTGMAGPLLVADMFVFLCAACFIFRNQKPVFIGLCSQKVSSQNTLTPKSVIRIKSPMETISPSNFILFFLTSALPCLKGKGEP